MAVEKYIGTVMALQANFYDVQLEAKPDRVLCNRRDRLKKIGQTVKVGDRVEVEAIDWVEQRGIIDRIYPRQSFLDRPPVANAHQIMLVFALKNPELDPWQLTRFLLQAEATNLNICLVLNKQDLIDHGAQDQWRDRLRGWGYHPFLVSTLNSPSLDALRTNLQGKTTIIAGPSGVGKSSLVNQLIPGLKLKVGKISGKLKRGRHTTRHVELFPLPQGGLLADTPGFNQPNLKPSPVELPQLFPEIRDRLGQGSCKFSDCSHRDEPQCAVRGDWERYEYYCQFLSEAIAAEATAHRQPDQESSLKVKISRSGKKQYEPKLKSNKYRRESRRHRHQELTKLDEASLLAEAGEDEE